jgi:superoxide dismutase, Cu-Zn family
MIISHIDPPYNELQKTLNNPADAQVIIKGSSKYPNISGTVELYHMIGAVLLVVQVDGLPQGSLPCAPSIYGFHIHEGSFS